MRRALLATFCAFAAVMLAAFAVPLDFVYRDAQRGRIENRLTETAYQVASNPKAAGDLSGVRVIVLNGEGISSFDSANKATTGISYTNRPEVAAALTGLASSGVRHSNTLDDDMLYAAVPVWRGGSTPVGVVRTSISMSEMDRQVGKERQGLLIGSLIAMIAAIAVGLNFSRWATKPLNALLETVEAHENGDLSRRAPERYGPREVRELAAQSNRTAASIETMLEERGRFAADAAHQLRTPLAALRIRLEMLTQTGSPEDADAALQVAERLERICVDLLRVARGENTEKVVTAVDAGVAILECAERWSDVCARRGVDIKWSNSNLRAACDADDLDVCLDEFVANALDATPENGAAISLSAREVENHKGRFVQFDVVDHGDGVRPESLGRVFEPFYRIQHDRDSIGGTGLGLSVVKTVAQRYAGEAVLESSRDQNGENTTVASLLLPMA